VPVYQYACTECGEQLEVRQSFTDAALTECPACSGRLRKVLNAVGVVFKGSGFYRNDSRAAANGSGNSGGSGGSGAGASGSADSGGKDGTAKKGDSSSSTGSSKDKSTSGKPGSGGAGSGTAGPTERSSGAGGGGKPAPAAAR